MSIRSKVPTAVWSAWSVIAFSGFGFLVSSVFGSSTPVSSVVASGVFSVTWGPLAAVLDGRGMIASNGNGPSGGTALLEPRIGGGMFGLDDTRGNAAIKMGHNGNRYGIVLAGPKLGFPLIPKSGLPGSYFMGCATAVRPACVPTIDP